ncbi:MAG: TonB-dependent receptor [Sphingobacteriales bacterium]|nr:MAG: TonB-dependent receptor [Sphingobacteriales bacterium]
MYLRTHSIKRKQVALLLAMLFSFCELQAQVVRDTLSEVKVKTRRRQKISADERINTYSPGQKVVSIDSITLQQYQFQNMANLLSQQVPVFVKSYGFNSLATLNFRGASAAQSQVYWNGIPLQNSGSGIADVSLLPVSLLNKVNVVYGSSSALLGSGNVGGALMVETDHPGYDSSGSFQHAVSGVVGSFNQYQLGIKSGLKTKRFSIGIKAFGQTANNDFNYYNGSNKVSTYNSKLQSGVVMVNSGYRIDKRNELLVTGWYQQYYREIPKALFEDVSTKNQRDESLRLLAEWKRTGNKANTYAKVAYFRDNMLYNDDTIKQHARYSTNQLFAEAGVNYRLNSHHQLLAFVPIQTSWIHRELMNDTKEQHKAAVALAYASNYFRERLNISATVRGEVVNEWSALLPGINASYQLTDWLKLRANVQRSFRAPTLNELYYVPGGNESLQAEEGWNEDAGYTLKLGASKRLTLIHDLSVFNRVIDNWVVWFGGAIWTPHNIASVHSRGIETENKLNYKINKNWSAYIGANTSYILATTLSSYVANDGSIGKQIPYTPRYNYQANIGFSYKTLFFNYNHTYTGYRFVTVDESQYLLPYNSGNIQLLYSLPVERLPLQVTAQVNNVWNQQYAVVNARPMPGANWLLGLKATIH